MASTIGKVRAVFTASTSGLTAGVNQASASMRRMQGDVAGLRGSMSSLVAIQGAQLFGSITAGVSNAVRSLVRMGQASAEVVDQTSKMAARLGMTYGELAGLALAGDLAGVSMNTIAAAATKADIAFVKAAGGSKTATAAFAAIGLSVDQLNGMSAAERFDAIAAAIAALPTEAQRAAAAVQIFGRAGAQLLPLFAQGAEGIAAARAEAERFGLTLTNAQGRNVEEMNDAFTRAQSAIQGVIQQVVAYLAPAIQSVTTAFSDLIGNVGGATIGQTIGEGILQGARYLAQIGDYIIQNFSSVFSYLSQVGGQWNASWDLGQRVANLFVGAFNVFEAVGNLVGGIISNVVAGLFRAAANLADLLPGFGGWADDLNASADRWAETTGAFDSAIMQNANEAAAAFSAAFGEGAAANAGEAIAGPLTSALDAAIASAEAAASAVDVASRQTVEIKQPVEVDAGPIRAAIQGVDSRSSEGVKEMFRIMRGDTGTQERIARGVERIADNTEDMGVEMDFEVSELPAAAGA